MSAAPGVPVWTAGVPVGSLPDEFNAKIRDPFTFFLSPPRFRARRTGAYTFTESTHQYIPWDTLDEDSHGGWSAPSVVGGGGSTTLSVAQAVGDTVITVASVANFAINDYVRVGSSAASQEHRRITAVGGSTLTVSQPFALAHAIGQSVVEVTSDPSRYIVPSTGWYDVSLVVSLSGTGAANLMVVGAVAVNGASHIGLGAAGWEGSAAFPPTGASTQPKIMPAFLSVYASEGDFIQGDIWYSTESAITAPDITAGIQCQIGLTWAGV